MEERRVGALNSVDRRAEVATNKEDGSGPYGVAKGSWRSAEER